MFHVMSCAFVPSIILLCVQYFTVISESVFFILFLILSQLSFFLFPVLLCSSASCVAGADPPFTYFIKFKSSSYFAIKSVLILCLLVKNYFQVVIWAGRLLHAPQYHPGLLFYAFPFSCFLFCKFPIEFYSIFSC